MSRVIIYVKDVSILMGTSDKTSREYLKKVREQVKKDRNTPVTAYDLSAAIGMEVSEVIRIINGK